MTPPEAPNEDQRGGLRPSHLFGLCLLAAAFLLVHVAAPWGLSLLSTRYGWADERPGMGNLAALLLVAAGIVGTFRMIVLHYLASSRTFVEWRPGRTLLAHGPYSVSRNPMYLCEFAFWLGWALFYGSLAVFAGLLIFFAVLDVAVVPWEERDLESRFGEAYRTCKARVPRWLGIPRH